MMAFDLSGIWYRIYTEVPFFLLAGTLIFLAGFISIRKKQKNGHKIGAEIGICCLIGAAAIIGSVVLLSHYIKSISALEVKSADCVFVEEYRDSSVAPPLPYTNGYVFKEVGKANSIIVYLDVFSAKKIILEALVPGEMYTVWYSSEDNIIVQLKPQQTDSVN